MSDINYKETRTVIIKKLDKRTASGDRLIKKVDVILRHDQVELAIQMLDAKYPRSKGYIVSVLNTYVEQVSFMDPSKKFWERFDTPYYCSPRSETYWCS